MKNRNEPTRRELRFREIQSRGDHYQWGADLGDVFGDWPVAPYEDASTVIKDWCRENSSYDSTIYEAPGDWWGWGHVFVERVHDWDHGEDTYFPDRYISVSVEVVE